MKKFLAIFMVILGVSIMLASQEMQMELLTYWETNGIEYLESDETILLPITDNFNICVAIMKNYDYIYFVFDADTKTEDFDTFILEPKKLPYSREFRDDLFDCLFETLNYLNTFGKLPDPRFEWFDDYLVYINFYIVGDSIIYLGID